MLHLLLETALQKNARDWSRTSTRLPSLAPQASASANSATRAGIIQLSRGPQAHATDISEVVLYFADYQRGIMPAETEGIAHNILYLLFAWHLGGVIQITLRVWVIQIDGRRYDGIPHSEC